MLGKHETLNDVNWENLVERVGRDALSRLIDGADLIGMVNWTMLPQMSQIWEQLLEEVFPAVERHGADPVHRPGRPREADPRRTSAPPWPADPVSGPGRRHPRPEPQGSGRDRGRARIAGPERPRGDDRGRRGGDPRALGLACVVIHPRGHAAAATRDRELLVRRAVRPAPHDQHGGRRPLQRGLLPRPDPRLRAWKRASAPGSRPAATTSGPRSATARQLSEFLAMLPPPEAVDAAS